MSFFADKVVCEGLTFDDVLLIPSYSESLPREIELSSWFTRNIRNNTPEFAAAMDKINGIKSHLIAVPDNVYAIRMLKTLFIICINYLNQ